MTIFDLAPLSEWRQHYQVAKILYKSCPPETVNRLLLKVALLSLRLTAAQKRIRELERMLGQNADN